MFGLEFRFPSAGEMLLLSGVELATTPILSRGLVAVYNGKLPDARSHL
jgi:hypothetical protein